MRTRIFLLAFLPALFLALSIQAKDINIVSYGAKPSKKKLSTTAIQRAIDDVSKSGGGKVIIPRGKFTTGAIVLKSGVTLHLEQGATLLGSKKPADYVLGNGRPGVIITSQLILAMNAKNIGISGQGIIDGQGKKFTDRACNAHGISRPMLIRFDTCKGVKISGVTMRNSGVWMQLYHACENLTITGVTIYNHGNKSNDGMDINACKNVRVSGVAVDADDDGIVLKNTIQQPCENIVVENCTISSHCNALKIGTETLGDFSNITFRNCTIRPSSQKKVVNGRRNGISAISIESVDGARISNVRVSDITVDGTETPIFIRLGDRGTTYGQKLAAKKRGSISGVTIENVTVTNAGTTGCSITGIPGQKVENVRLSNIDIHHSGGMGAVASPRDEKEKAYPEGTMWGTLPAKGFFVKNARNVSFEGVNIRTSRTDARPGLVKENVE